MKDLIKRLRDTASKGVSVWGDLQMEAADAIEKLEAENAALKIRLDVTLDNYGHTARERAALKAELAALRDQKPVGFVHYVGGTIDGAVIREVRFSNETPLYRAAGAKP